MKPPHVRPSLLEMTIFVFMISLGSSLDCKADFKLPLFFEINSVQGISSAMDKIFATLPEIVTLGDKVSFPPDAPVFEALKIVFRFLKDSRNGLIDANMKSKLAEVEKKVSSMLDSKVSVDVKKKDWVTAVNICEDVFISFTDSKSPFNKAKPASSPYYVAFATVYLTVSQLGKAFNPQYIPKLKEDMQRLLENLAEFEFEVKPQRKFMLQKKKNTVSDAMTGLMYNDVSCHWPWRQELVNGIKKFFTPIKESVAAYAGVPVPVKYQYYTRWGEECFYTCGYHEGTAYSWCWTMSGLGTDWESCSVEKDVTRYGDRCNSDHSCDWHGKDYYWCWTGSMFWDWGYCSPKTIQ